MTAMTGLAGGNRKLPADKGHLFMRPARKAFRGALSCASVMMIPRGAVLYGLGDGMCRLWRTI